MIEDSFPVISETFILDQITGLIDRGLNIENWALQYLDQGVCHSKVIKYGLVEKTRYLKLPATYFRNNPTAWTTELAQQNGLGDLSTIRAFHVNYGTNFITFEPLFQALDTYLIVSFYGYDASKYIIEHGAHCYDSLFRRADLITTPTICMMEELVRKGCPEHKIKVIRCGVEIPDNFIQHRNNTAKITILTVARLVEKKGIEYALRALALCSYRTRIRYRIIGDGPLNRELRLLATQLGINDQVDFLGFLPLEKMQEEMKLADIVLLTSVTAANGDQEGLPVTLVTAQAMGLPVISSYHSGIPELVINGMTGLLSQERDVNQIAINMDRLVNDPGMRRSFGANGRERVRAEFDKEIHNDRLARYLVDGPGKECFSNAPGVECPICGEFFDSFAPYGVELRSNALCPGCNSLERHRLLWLFLKERTNLFTTLHLKVLDIAPVPFLSELLMQIPFMQYLSVDINSSHAMRKMDITRLLLPDDYFDCILCYHVLEHIPEDRKAMSELYRVMKPGGWGIIQVPLKAGLENTIEDLSITDPQERLRLYGNEDHVRYYGSDYKDKLEGVGFTVKVDQFAGKYSGNDVKRFGISRDEPIYYCIKPFADADGRRIDNSRLKNISTFVSVAIPVYNRASYLVDAVNSALSQNYDNFEVVVVDDGSTDNTAEAVRQFNDSRLRYVLKEHSGAPATRNRCIAEARGDYVLWLDSDDRLLPGALASYARVLKDFPEADVIYGDLEITDSRFSHMEDLAYYDWHGRNRELLAEFFRYNAIPNPGTLVRKSCYEQFGGYDVSYKRAHDYEFWVRIALKAVFKHVDATVVQWRWHDSNMSSGSVKIDTSYDARLVQGMLDRYDIKELFTSFDWNTDAEVEVNAWIAIAKRFMDLQDVTTAVKYFAKACCLKPTSDMLALYKQLQGIEQSLESLNSDKSSSRKRKPPAPQVSVIVPTHNRPEMLREAIGSILAQTFQDFEVIVVNDAGTDVEHIVASFDSQKIRYLAHESNRGLAAARNTAIRAAQGKYIAYLDDDDRYYPDHLATLVERLESDSCQVAYSDAYRVHQVRQGEDGYVTINRDIPYSYEFDADEILVDNCFPVLCAMHHKSCLDDAGMFDESLQRLEDWDLWIRLSRRFAFCHIKKVTCEYSHRLDESSMTGSSAPLFLQSYRAVCRKYAGFANRSERIPLLQKKATFSHLFSTYEFIERQIGTVIDADDVGRALASSGILQRIQSMGISEQQIASATARLYAQMSSENQPLAERLLRDALAIDPTNPPAQIDLVKLLIRQKRHDDALDCLEKILRQNPGDADISCVFADLAANRPDLRDRVRHSLDLALSIKTDNAELLSRVKSYGI